MGLRFVSENIYLKDYPEIMEMFERTTSIEQRAVSFKVKEGYKNKIIETFNNTFGNDFSLYKKKDIIDSKLFGDGVSNELFEEAIGDFIAIAEKSNKCLLTDGDNPQFSQHAGYTDEKIYIPLGLLDYIPTSKVIVRFGIIKFKKPVSLVIQLHKKMLYIISSLMYNIQ